MNENILIQLNLKENHYGDFVQILFSNNSDKIALMALTSFLHEILKILLMEANSFVKLIKLQWWRDFFNKIKNHDPNVENHLLKSEFIKLHKHSQQHFDELMEIIEIADEIITIEEFKDWQDLATLLKKIFVIYDNLFFAHLKMAKKDCENLAKIQVIKFILSDHKQVFQIQENHDALHQKAIKDAEKIIKNKDLHKDYRRFAKSLKLDLLENRPINFTRILKLIWL